MTRCARCDFTTDPAAETTEAEQAAEHSLAASHPLCVVCHHSLDQSEQQACEKCLTNARADLAVITALYAELPAHLGHVRSPVYDADRHSDDETALPGGDVLVLLAAGSEGLADNALTVKEGDPTSIAFELDWWERELRESRHDEMPTDPETPATVVRHAAAYLEVHARWAANNHPGFDDLAADLKRLRRILEHVTAHADVREVAEAECLSCGGELVREVRPRDEEKDSGGRRKGTDPEGYQQGFTCQNKSCGRVYQQPAPDERNRHDEYAVALHQHMRDNPAEWAPADLLGEWFGVSPTLLRVWKHRGQVETMTRYDVTLYRVQCGVPTTEAKSA